MEIGEARSMGKKKRKSEIKLKIYRHRKAKGDGKKGINEGKKKHSIEFRVCVRFLR